MIMKLTKVTKLLCKAPFLRLKGLPTLFAGMKQRLLSSPRVNLEQPLIRVGHDKLPVSVQSQTMRTTTYWLIVHTRAYMKNNMTTCKYSTITDARLYQETRVSAN